MSDEPSEDRPPQPILIQSGIASTGELVLPEQSDASTPVIPANATSDGLAKAIAHYEDLMAMKDPGNGLGYIAFSSFLEDQFLDFLLWTVSWILRRPPTSAAVVSSSASCWVWSALLFLLGFISFVKSGTYQDEVKKAYRAVQAEAMIQPPPTTYTNALLGVLLFLLGFISFATTNTFVLGFIMIATGVVLASTADASNRKKARQHVLVQAKLELERRNHRPRSSSPRIECSVGGGLDCPFLVDGHRFCVTVLAERSITRQRAR